MQVTTTFRETKTFEGEKEGRAWKKIVFEAADGREYATFDAVLASKAAGLLNTPVTVTFEEKQRGKFTNYDLKDVAPATNGDTQSVTDEQVKRIMNLPPLQIHSDKDERITRAVALKAAMEAFGIAGQDPILARSEVIEYAETLIPWLHTGVYED